jgi:hypothetical protein
MIQEITLSKDIKVAGKSEEQQFASTGAKFYDYEQELKHCWNDCSRDWSSVYPTKVYSHFWNDRDQTK